MTRRRWYAVAVAAAVACGVAAVVLLQTRNPPCPVDASSVLLQAFATRTPNRPRWTGCFDRDAGQLPFVSALQTRGALAAFELGARTARVDSIESFGVALALAGDTVKAIQTLQGLTSYEQQSATLSDLAAAHLVRASASHSGNDLVLALEFASHAVALDARSASARFNEALALTELHLDEEADRSWREYLEIDSQSSWSDLARQQLQAPQRHAASASAQLMDLMARTVDDEAAVERVCVEAAQACREYLEETVLPHWGQAVSKADGTADEVLTRARLLAGALRRRDDELDWDTIADVDAAVVRREARIADLAAGFIAYGEARELFEEGGDFAPRFAEAERRLGAARSPLVGWVRSNRVYAEFSQYDSRRLQEMGQTLLSWAREADSRRYGALAGRLFYLAALTYGNRAEYDSAAPLFTASIADLERTAEREHLASTYVALADLDFHLGDTDQAWHWYVSVFDTLRETLSARRRYAIYLNAGIWLGNLHIDHAAIRVLTSAKDIAVQSATPSRVSESSLYRAKAYSRLGYQDAARADLAAAQPDPQRNGRWGVSERAKNEYLAGVAEVEMAADAPRSIAAATEALTFFQGRGFATRVAGLYLIRGKAYRQTGALDRASADFAAGVDVYERYRNQLSSAQQRLSSQEVVWGLYEEQLGLASADPVRALDLAERARARTLLDAVRGAGQPVSPRVLENVLVGNQRVLYYALLPHELLIWVIGPGWTKSARQPVDWDVVDRLVSAMAEGIARGGPDRDWQPGAERLFDLLVGPVAGFLTPGTSITIVPDGPLNRLPFAALRNATTRQWFVDEHNLATAPSATLLMDFAKRPAASSPPRRALIVGAPSPLMPESAPLKGAAEEAQTIAGLYPAVDVLSGKTATKARFVSEASRAEIIHFAGHAISSPDYPLLAHLELAGETGVTGSSNLVAEEIAAIRMERTRLVVLAACQTAAGVIHHGEGVMSLARPFLIAGVPSVIATLWNIDDAMTAPFVSRLHERLALGVPADVALNDVQRQLQRTTPAALWSSFVLIGSASSPVNTTHQERVQ